MDLTKSKYDIRSDAPAVMNEDAYYEKAREEYLRLLNLELVEDEYQHFFEQNPAFMPGSREVIGSASSHWPVLNTLISQARISDDERIRIPDFMWIAKNSTHLCPVLIEIEKPSKQEFRTNSDVSRAQFTQALTQIKHWKAILNTTEGKEDFYRRYNIPSELRLLKFSPQYVLVFGRRSEYEGDSWLTRIRAEEETADMRIMSFDRLASPDRNAFDCVTSKVINGEYHIIHIPPTFVFSPFTIDAIGGYAEYRGFKAAVNKMAYTSDDRKAFLKERFDYWKDIAPEIHEGIMKYSDKE